MNEDKLEIWLERIAKALEHIAELMEYSSAHRTKCLHELRAVDADNSVIIQPDHGDVHDGVLERFLSSKGITIVNIPEEDAADQVIESLSLYLGQRYDALSGLLAKIKRAMQTGMLITESLKERSQEDISSVCQFCTRLHEVAFLEQYQYIRSPTYVIKAKTTTLPRAQRFFGGQWLERFVLQKLKSIYCHLASSTEDHLYFECLINPHITLPNGDAFEMDILAAIGSNIYWIEAKSGDYQQHVAKYSKLSRYLGLDSSHTLMVLTDAPDHLCDALSSLFSMAVCNLRSFENKLLAVAQYDVEQTIGSAIDQCQP